MIRTSNIYTVRLSNEQRDAADKKRKKLKLATLSDLIRLGLEEIQVPVK